MGLGHAYGLGGPSFHATAQPSCMSTAALHTTVITALQATAMRCKDESHASAMLLMPRTTMLGIASLALLDHVFWHQHHGPSPLSFPSRGVQLTTLPDLLRGAVSCRLVKYTNSRF